MNTKKLAELIYSVAQYDGYNTSILQTQKTFLQTRMSGNLPMKQIAIYLKI